MDADEFAEALGADVVIPVTPEAVYALRQEIVRLQAENGRLWDAVYVLFASLPMQYVNELTPEILELCHHSMHRLTHEQRMMRR